MAPFTEGTRTPEPYKRRRGLWLVYRWWYALVRKSLGVATVFWLTTSIGGLGAIVYGCITGPRLLRAQARALKSLRDQFAQASRERDDTRDFIYWLAAKECARIPLERLRFGEDARACGLVAHRSGGLFLTTDPDSADGSSR